MPRYSVSLIFASLEEGAAAPIDHEESIVLFHAKTLEEAQRLGLRDGGNREHSYIAATGKRVTWKFLGIASIFEIMEDGPQGVGEVFSRLLGPGKLAGTVFEIQYPATSLS